jgi:hypothetical protein
MMNGLTLDKIFIERGVLGSKPVGERPEGARLLSTLESGDAVITPKRFGRRRDRERHLEASLYDPLGSGRGSATGFANVSAM